jgi:archaellum biogenesis protein FlaJ (TadC family)
LVVVVVVVIVLEALLSKEKKITYLFVSFEYILIISFTCLLAYMMVQTFDDFQVGKKIEEDEEEEEEELLNCWILLSISFSFSLSQIDRWRKQQENNQQ